MATSSELFARIHTLATNGTGDPGIRPIESGKFLAMITRIFEDLERDGKGLSKEQFDERYPSTS
jgi:hypothetical protein